MKKTRYATRMGVIGALSFLMVACGGGIDIVKDGTFDNIEGVKIGDLFDKRFEDGKWSSSENEIGQTIITFVGTTKPYRANLPNEEWNKYSLTSINADILIQTGDPTIGKAYLSEAKSWDDVASALWPIDQMTITFLITDKENKLFQLNTCDIPKWPLGCHGNQFEPYLKNGQSY